MQGTRQQILKILKERGQSTVEELSTELQLTSATVRHHLDILRGDSLVEMSEIRRRATPGRPQYVYALTEAASHHFPQNYAGLVDALLAEIEARLAPAECDAIWQGTANRIAGEFPPAPPNESLETRLERAVDFLNAKGFMAHYAKGDEGYSLHVINCPYHAVARAHAQLCKVDMSLVSQLLSVTLRRSSHTTSGEGACVFYFDAPASGTSAAPALTAPA